MPASKHLRRSRRRTAFGVAAACVLVGTAAVAPAEGGDAAARALRKARRGGGVLPLPTDPPPGNVPDLPPWWLDPFGEAPRDDSLDAGGFVVCGDGATYENLADLGLGDPYVGSDYFVIGPMAEGDVDQAFLDWLVAALPGACIEPDWRMRPPEGLQSNRIIVGSELGAAYPVQPALQQIGAPIAHRIATGRDVVVAVLDTGVDATHASLAGVVLPGADFVDMDLDAADAADGIDSDDDGEADESFGHGTIVAGLVHVAAPGARILPVRVLDSDGLGSARSVADGVRYAREQGADVINLSLGMRAHSVLVEEEIRLALEQGIVVVAASGNEGRRGADFPASVEGVVAATAVGRNGRRARFANGRGKLGVVAPGRDLVGPYPGATWARATGTSFSAALVSAAAALLRERRPELGGFEAAEILTQSPRLRLPRLLR